MESRVTRVMGFLPAYFQLATSFHSRLRVRHGTDGQTTTINALCPTLGGGHNKIQRNVSPPTRRCLKSAVQTVVCKSDTIWTRLTVSRLYCSETPKTRPSGKPPRRRRRSRTEETTRDTLPACPTTTQTRVQNKCPQLRQQRSVTREIMPPQAGYLGGLQKCIFGADGAIIFFTDRMPFLVPNDECDSNGKTIFVFVYIGQVFQRLLRVRPGTLKVPWKRSFEDCRCKNNLFKSTWTEHMFAKATHPQTL